MKKTLGIVNLHHAVSLGDLTAKRSIASVNLLGRYSFIDFVISNYTNSGINDIIVLVKERVRSLLHHFGFGQLNYTINLKTGGLSILVNEQYISTPIYNTDINNMLENLIYLRDADVDNFIIAPAHMLACVDYRPFLRMHEESGRQISILYSEVDDARNEFLNSFFVRLDGDRVSQIQINKGLSRKEKIFMETTIISKEKLLELLSRANDISRLYSFRDLLIYHLQQEEVGALRYEGYFKCFDSLDHYADFSLGLLEASERNRLFHNTIYTRTYDTPPTRYGTQASVSHSFIANGAVILGSVSDSIIGRGVVIEKGAQVTNSIILSNSRIGRDIVLDRVVIDKNVVVEETKTIKGGKHYIVIGQGERV